MRKRAPGEGTIVRRSDGRWMGALQVNGVRRCVYGATRAEARAKLEDLKRQVAGGVLPAPGRRTVNDLLTAWLEVAGPGLRPSTLASYEGVIRLHIAPAIGHIRLSRLRPATLQALYSALQGRGLQRTPAKVHAVLRRAFRLAVLWGWVGSDPTARVVAPAYRPQERRWWTPEEVRTFLAGAGRSRYFPVFALLLVSGCRLGELLALKWEDIDWATGSIVIRRSVQHVARRRVVGRPKTKSGERTIVLPDSVLALLAQKRAASQGSAWVFEGRSPGQPLGHAAVERALKRLCHDLGMAPITPHGLRHLHASLLLAGGLPLTDVSKRLGHASTQVTAMVYSHALPGRDREAVRLLEAVVGGER